jgi:N-acetylglucosaminylphosphatidylinositol deacetylase
MINYVLITAHPDDESMFFLPTLFNLIKHCNTDDTFHILCLSNGNYDGIGYIREKELLKAIMVISDRIHLTVVLNEKLQDGPNQTWHQDAIVNEIRSKVQYLHGDLVLITFDEGGISNHPNHIDTCTGTTKFFEEQSRTNSDSNLQLWKLKTIYNPLQKYVIIFEIVFRLAKFLLATFVLTKSKKEQNWKTFFMFHPILTWRAMKMHHSQFVWYRRLFVLFSCYSYWNDLCIHEMKKYEVKKNH